MAPYGQQRTAHIPEETLKLFWDLAAVDQSSRREATARLMTQVESITSLEDEVTRNNEGTTLQYCLRRLVRGLSSSRDAARQGFAAALVELLRQHPEVTNEALSEQVELHLNLKGQQKQDRKDIMFGRVCAISALVASDRLPSLQSKIASSNGKKKRRVSDNQQSFLLEMCKAYATELLCLAEKKAYLAEICYRVLADMLTVIPPGVFAEAFLPLIEPLAKKSISEVSPEELYLWLRLEAGQNDHFKWSQYCPDISGRMVLASCNHTLLAAPLIAAVSAHPRMHSVWHTTCDALIAMCERKRSGARLYSFWNAVVEGPLFSGQSLNKKHLGFLVFQRLCAGIDIRLVSGLFSKNFMRCLINHLSSSETNLRKMARQTLELTVSRATGTQRTSSDDREDSDSDDNEAEVDGAMLIVTQLLGPFGHRDFDRISKTNAVARLLRHVQPESARSYFKELSLSLRSAKMSDEQDDNDGGSEDAVRVWALNQMYSLSKAFMSISVENEERNSVLEQLVQTFLFFSFFQPSANAKALSKKKKKKKSNRGSSFLADLISETTTPVSEKVREISNARLQSLLRDLCRSASSTNKGNASPEESSRLWMHFVVSTFDTFLKEKTSELAVDHLQEWDSVADDIDVCCEFVEQMSAGAKKEGSKGLATAMLDTCLLTAFTLLLDGEECWETFEDLQTCAANVCGDDPQDESRLEDLKVWVDVLLFLLGHESAFIKDGVLRLFKTLAPVVSFDGIAPVVQVLSGEESKETDEDEKSETEEADESDDDDEKKNGEDSNDEAEDDDDDDADADDADDDDDDDNDTDDGSEEEVLMNDEQMMELDASLAQLFRQRKEKEREQKRAAKGTMQLRLRALDLLEVYVRHNKCIQDLMRLLDKLLFIAALPGKDNAPIVQKTSTLLRTLCKKRDLEHGGSEIKDLFEKINETLIKSVCRGSGASDAKMPKIQGDVMQLVPLVIGFAARMLLLECAEESTGKQRKKRQNKKTRVELAHKKSSISIKFLSSLIERLPRFTSISQALEGEHRHGLHSIARMPFVVLRRLAPLLETAHNSFKRQSVIQLFAQCIRLCPDLKQLSEETDSDLNNLVSVCRSDVRTACQTLAQAVAARVLSAAELVALKANRVLEIVKLLNESVVQTKRLLGVADGEELADAFGLSFVEAVRRVQATKAANKASRLNTICVSMLCHLGQAKLQGGASAAPQKRARDAKKDPAAEKGSTVRKGKKQNKRMRTE